MAEIEAILGGAPSAPRLRPELGERLAARATVVLVLFDGLGHHQLGEATPALTASDVGPLTAPFPSMTSVALATVGTGMTPAQHGVIGHLMWLPSERRVVNTLRWVDLAGAPVSYPTTGLLPSPNLWERLVASGVEPITVQPGDFVDTPLTRALYRGCRFESVFSPWEAIEATVQLARRPGRFIFTYLPQVDFAAHVYGQDSPEYRRTVTAMDDLWSALVARLDHTVTVVGTADHGLLDYRPGDKVLLRGEFDRLIAYGDPRSVYLKGESSLIEEFARLSGGSLLDPDRAGGLWGEGPSHPELGRRSPDAVVLAPSGKVLLPRGFDKRLIGYHGGLDRREMEIPLLIG